MTAAAAEWRPSPTCLGGHQLEAKPVAGSWFGSGKKCTCCGAALTSGLVRHSCKSCAYHLCNVCQAARSEEMLGEAITLTVYRQAQPGLLPGLLPGLGGNDEDAWQVSVQRGANVGALKAQVFNLYGLNPGLQVLRRSVDEPPLPDSELLRCDEGDVLLLGGLGSGAGGLPSLPGLGGLAEAVSSAMGAVTGAMERAEEQRRQLENTEYKLNILMPAQAARKRPEKRCQVTVVAMARIREVVQMAQLELSVEDTAMSLEFAGERLSLDAPIFALNIQDGDTLMLVPGSAAVESL